MRRKEWPVYWPIPEGVIAGGIFSATVEQELKERLRQGPAEAARIQSQRSEASGAPSRWTLRTIRAEIAWLAEYSLSGVWRLLARTGIGLRSAQVQQFSPDPEYGDKVARLLEVLRAAVEQPEQVVALFLDEMGFYRWPREGQDWALSAPLADRQGSKQQQWRLIGTLTSRVK